jgi:EAL domain-containing protein (putative c-di-GMP-specific phosphodiesterase class I)
MAPQANLADLNRMLGIKLFLDLEEHSLINDPQQGLVCHILGLRLATAFQAILRPDGRIIGREALLRTTQIDQSSLTPEAAFIEANKSDRLVQFDRLVRTIHLLNHSNRYDDFELLFLNVHSQLLSRVADHGRTFEQILHYYSVPTSQVVIEIKESAVKVDAQLEKAVMNYRQLGYLIAIDNVGTNDDFLNTLFHPDSSYNKLSSIKGLPWLNRVLNLRPNFIKLDGSVIRQAERHPQALLILRRLINLFHVIETRVILQQIETAEQLKIGRSVGADLFQGNYLARPECAAYARECLAA